MKSKKVLAMGLAGVMAFGMVGCSTPGSETTAAAGDSTTAAATAERPQRQVILPPQQLPRIPVA